MTAPRVFSRASMAAPRRLLVEAGDPMPATRDPHRPYGPGLAARQRVGGAIMGPHPGRALPRAGADHAHAADHRMAARQSLRPQDRAESKPPTLPGGRWAAMVRQAWIRKPSTGFPASNTMAAKLTTWASPARIRPRPGRARPRGRRRSCPFRRGADARGEDEDVGVRARPPAIPAAASFSRISSSRGQVGLGQQAIAAPFPEPSGQAVEQPVVHELVGVPGVVGPGLHAAQGSGAASPGTRSRRWDWTDEVSVPAVN